MMNWGRDGSHEHEVHEVHGVAATDHSHSELRDARHRIEALAGRVDDMEAQLAEQRLINGTMTEITERLTMIVERIAGRLAGGGMSEVLEDFPGPG
jgi:hypothetical protein